MFNTSNNSLHLYTPEPNKKPELYNGDALYSFILRGNKYIGNETVSKIISDYNKPLHYEIPSKKVTISLLNTKDKRKDIPDESILDSINPVPDGIKSERKQSGAMNIHKELVGIQEKGMTPEQKKSAKTIATIMIGLGIILFVAKNF